MATDRGRNNVNLCDFLKGSFRPEDFDDFLAEHGYKAVAFSVPRTATAGRYFFSVVRQLDGRKQIDGKFFDGLMAARPDNAELIQGLRESKLSEVRTTVPSKVDSIRVIRKSPVPQEGTTVPVKADSIRVTRNPAVPRERTTPKSASIPTPGGVSEANRRIRKAGVESAERLDLSGLGLSRLPESIGQLKELTWLNLRRNELSALPESLGQLKRLQELHIGSNQLSSVPEWLGQLDNLNALGLAANQLSSLPESLGQLKQLNFLGLGSNNLLSVPPSLGELKQLRKLHLDRNRLPSLPESLGQLSALETLDLSDNQLTALPSSLTGLPMLKGLFLHGNEGLGIPPEVLGPTYKDVTNKASAPADPTGILGYYFQLRGGNRPLNEVKFILMGRGGVGKTSLVNRLVRNMFNSELGEDRGNPGHAVARTGRERMGTAQRLGLRWPGDHARHPPVLPDRAEPLPGRPQRSRGCGGRERRVLVEAGLKLRVRVAGDRRAQQDERAPLRREPPRIAL